ncbi:hypothetical protein CHUAL_006707 [Chamberlinius hualienensis]
MATTVFAKIFAIAFYIFISTHALPDMIRIGGLFDRDDGSLEMAFISAVNRVNANGQILPKSRLVAQIETIGQDDSLEASKRVCSLMETGVAAIFGPQSSESATHVQSICDALEVPHIESRWDFRSHGVNLYPHPPTLSKAYEDLIRMFEWTSFAIIYEDHDGLVRLKNLYKTPPNKNPFKIFLRQLPANGRYREIFREIKEKNIGNIVIDCNVGLIYQVLKQAQQIGLMTENHHYVITNMDLDTVDVEDFQYVGAEITALRLVDPKRTEVTKVVNEMRAAERHIVRKIGERADFTLKTETALMFDAVYLFAKALHDLDSSQTITIKPLSCESESPWGPGNSLINYMKVVQLNGVSGIVGFDTNGFRSNFDLDVVEVSPHGVTKVGTWSSRFKDKHHIGLNMTRRVLRLGGEIIEKKIIKVAAILNEPYVMIRESKDSLNGNELYEGFAVDLLIEISKMVGFDYIIYETADQSYGSRNSETNEWNGVIKEIIDKQAGLGIGDLTITSEREEVVDFSMPFMNLGISILFVKPTPSHPNILSFLSPFSSDVWLYIAVTYLCVSLILFLLARLSPYEWKPVKTPTSKVAQLTTTTNQETKELQNQFGLLNSMWFTIGSLMQQGSDLAPRAASTRLVAAMWWFFILIMLSSYTANLAAFLAVEKSESPIKDIKDLAQQTRIKYGCVKTGSTMAFFRDSKIPMYHDMWKQMESFNTFVNGNKDGVAKVKEGNFAYFIESTSNDYIVERECELARIGGLLDSKGYGFAVPKGS